MPPPDGSDSGDQAKPICEQDEDEYRGEEPERLPRKLGADHFLKEVVKRLDKPFPEVLRAFRYALDVARRDLREDDHRRGNNPCH